MSTEESHRVWTKFVAGALLGAGAMYVLDPDRGRRRRALIRDKARSSIANVEHLACVATRDIAHRLQGVRARTRQLFQQNGVPDDLVLIERVRAAMGRVVSHPHAVQIGARDGEVMLSGPILSAEVPRLLAAVWTVPGVVKVNNMLVPHATAGSVPGLQGGVPRPGTVALFARRNWTPRTRAAAILGGGMLCAYALRHRTLAGAALGAIGLGLTARGANNGQGGRAAGAAAAPANRRRGNGASPDVASPDVAPEPRMDRPGVGAQASTANRAGDLNPG